MKRILLASLVLLGGFASQARAADTVYYYYNDALGSPVAVTDANGTVIERTQYAPYGQVLNRPEHDGPGYTKHEEDAATGLTNMQQRYDDKVIGRMLSMDPMDVDTATGSNFNRYAYAADNPYRFIDPDGRDACKADSGGNVHCSPPSPPITGCLTSGCSASANTSVMQVGSPSKSDAQKMQAQAKKSAGHSAGNSAGSPGGSASGQNSTGSSQSEKTPKEWTVQEFNDLDQRATNSYAPLFLAPVGLGAGTAAVYVGGPIAWPYVRPVVFTGCMALGWCNPETVQHLNDYAETRQRLATMLNTAQSQISQWWQQVIKP